MTLDFATIKKYHAACKPEESLEPFDPRNLDMDDLSAGDNPVRGYRWASRLARSIIMSDTPVTKLCTGMPGSGITTELKRLTKRLSEQGNLLPLYIDAHEYMDLTNPIDVTDVLMAVLYGAEYGMAEAEGGDLETVLETGYFRRLWGWLQTETELSKLQVGIPSAGKLVLEMKTRPDLRAQVRKAVASHFSRFHAEICAELIKLQVRAKKLGKDGVIILLDSVEKLQGISTNWHEVLESAERVFVSNMHFLELPVNVLYTVPPSLTSRVRKTELEFLPMIKVRDRMGQDHEAGIDMAQQLVLKRIDEPGLEGILGNNWQQRLRKIITGSGGYPREILQILQELLLADDFPIRDTDFRRALNRFTDPFSNIV